MIPFVIFIGYFCAENSYFGWHAKAQSDAEMICDGIFFILLMLAEINSTIRKIKK